MTSTVCRFLGNFSMMSCTVKSSTFLQIVGSNLLSISTLTVSYPKKSNTFPIDFVPQNNSNKTGIWFISSNLICVMFQEFTEAVEKLWKSCGKAVEKLWKNPGMSRLLSRLVALVRGPTDLSHIGSVHSTGFKNLLQLFHSFSAPFPQLFCSFSTAYHISSLAFDMFH